MLAALLAYAFWAKAVLVDVGQVTRGELVVDVRAEGRTRVRDLYVITAPLAGHLQRLHAGHTVGGEVLGDEVVHAFVQVRGERVHVQG